jgi:hypothetical protein
MGPGWPNVDEEMLASTAATYEALAAKITGSIVPQQQGQLMKLADAWEGAGALAATGEATTIIGGHDANAGQTGMFGSLMQQAMQAAQDGGGGQSFDGQDAGGAAGASGGGAPSPAGAVAQHPVRDNAVGAKEEQQRHVHEPQREEREPLHRAETNDRAMAGPSDHRHGAAPVKLPEHQHNRDDDLGRRM